MLTLGKTEEPPIVVRAHSVGDVKAMTESALILTAYNESGYCAPMLLRRLGITEGNRQTFSLGMFLDQLVNPGPYGPFSGLWEWQAPPGERLEDYAKKAWAQQPHTGETPVTVIEEATRRAQLAVNAIEKAAPLVTRNQDEFERLRNDMHCIRLVSQTYAEKVLVGYFNENRTLWAKPPNLDIDSQAAKYGGVESLLQNVMQLEGSPRVNLHVFSFPAGEITFDPRSPGSYLILGIIPADMKIIPRDVGISPGRRERVNLILNRKPLWQSASAG